MQPLLYSAIASQSGWGGWATESPVALAGCLFTVVSKLSEPASGSIGLIIHSSKVEADRVELVVVLVHQLKLLSPLPASMA